MTGLDTEEQGKFDLGEDRLYIGQRVDGQPHGFGSCIKSSATCSSTGGAAYSGQWSYGYELCGVICWPNGNMFAGTWSEGKPHGSGIQTKGKWIYRGQFSCGACGPLGVKRNMQNQSMYEGSWAVNRFEGFGIETCSDGGMYAGAWSKGLRHGVGVRRVIIPSISQNSEQPQTKPNESGIFKKDSIQTCLSISIDDNSSQKNSVRTRASLKRLKKQYSDLGSRDDSPVQVKEPELHADTSMNRSETRDQQINNEIDNDGKKVSLDLGEHVVDIGHSADTEIYAGEWYEDARSGYGIVERSNGYRYVGEWLRNQKHGYGVIYYPDGDQEGGFFQADVMIDRLNKRIRWNVIYQNKLKSNVDNAVIRATEMANLAKTSSIEQARRKAQLARNAAHGAQQVVNRARYLSERAYKLTKEIAPDIENAGFIWKDAKEFECKMKKEVHENVLQFDRPLHPDDVSSSLDDLMIPYNKPEVRNSVLQLGRIWRNKLRRKLALKSSPRRMESTKQHNDKLIECMDTFEKYALIGNPGMSRSVLMDAAYFQSSTEMQTPDLTDSIEKDEKRCIRKAFEKQGSVEQYSPMTQTYTSSEDELVCQSVCSTAVCRPVQQPISESNQSRVVHRNSPQYMKPRKMNGIHQLTRSADRSSTAWDGGRTVKQRIRMESLGSDKQSEMDLDRIQKSTSPRWCRQENIVETESPRFAQQTRYSNNHAPKLRSRGTQDSGYSSQGLSDRSFSMLNFSRSTSLQMSPASEHCDVSTRTRRREADALNVRLPDTIEESNNGHLTTDSDAMDLERPESRVDASDPRDRSIDRMRWSRYGPEIGHSIEYPPVALSTPQKHPHVFYTPQHKPSNESHRKLHACPYGTPHFVTCEHPRGSSYVCRQQPARRSKLTSAYDVETSCSDFSSSSGPPATMNYRDSSCRWMKGPFRSSQMPVIVCPTCQIIVDSSHFNHPPSWQTYGRAFTPVMRGMNMSDMRKDEMYGLHPCTNTPRQCQPITPHFPTTHTCTRARVPSDPTNYQIDWNSIHHDRNVNTYSETYGVPSYDNHIPNSTSQPESSLDSNRIDRLTPYSISPLTIGSYSNHYGGLQMNNDHFGSIIQTPDNMFGSSIQVKQSNSCQTPRLPVQSVNGPTSVQIDGDSNMVRRNVCRTRSEKDDESMELIGNFNRTKYSSVHRVSWPRRKSNSSVSTSEAHSERSNSTGTVVPMSQTPSEQTVNLIRIERDTDGDCQLEGVESTKNRFGTVWCTCVEYLHSGYRTCSIVKIWLMQNSTGISLTLLNIVIVLLLVIIHRLYWIKSDTIE